MDSQEEMMDLSSIQRQHVDAAIREVLRSGAPEERRSRKFCLLVRGVHLPPKFIVGIAHRNAVGDELVPQEFSGGSQSNDLLRAMGFVIVACSCGGVGVRGQGGSGNVTSHEVVEAPKTDVMRADAAHMFRVALVLPYNKGDTEGLTNPSNYLNQGIDLVVFPESWIKPETPERDDALRFLARGASVDVFAGAKRGGYQLLRHFPAGGGTPRDIYTKHSTTDDVAFADSQWSADVNLPVVTIKDVRVGVTICHDLYLGLLQRVLGNRGADVWINPSFDKVKDEKWGNLLRLRSIENGFASLCTLHANYGVNRVHPFGFSRSGEELSACLLGTHSDSHPLQECREGHKVYVTDVPLNDKAAREDVTIIPAAVKPQSPRTGEHSKIVSVGQSGKVKWVGESSRPITFDTKMKVIPYNNTNGEVRLIEETPLMFFAINGMQLLDVTRFWHAIDRAHAVGARPVFWNHWDQLPTGSDRLVSLMLGRSLECMAPVILSDEYGIHEVTEVGNASKVLRRVHFGSKGPHAAVTIDVDKALGWCSAFKMVLQHMPKNQHSLARKRYLSLAK